MRIMSTRTVAAFLLAIGLATLPARAANIWDGGGVDNNWGTQTNWDNNIVPGNPTNALIFIAGTNRPTPVVNTPWSVLGIVFSNNNTTVPFTLGGTSLTFTANRADAAEPFVLKQMAAITHTITNFIFIGATGAPAANVRRTIQIDGAGGLILNGLITRSAVDTNGELWIRGGGSGTNTINGRILGFGNSPLRKLGSITLLLNG